MGYINSQGVYVSTDPTGSGGFNTTGSSKVNPTPTKTTDPNAPPAGWSPGQGPAGANQTWIGSDGNQYAYDQNGKPTLWKQLVTPKGSSTSPAPTTLISGSNPTPSPTNPNADTTGTNTGVDSATSTTQSDTARRVNAAATQAESDLADPFAPGGAFDQAFAKETSLSQAKIDAINQQVEAKIKGEKDVGQQRTASTAATLSAAGLTGSTAAASTYAATDQLTEDQIAQVNADRYTAVTQALDDIQQRAKTDVTTNAQNAIAAQKDMQSKAVDTIKTLSSSEVDFQAFKDKYPDEYNALVQQMGGDPNAVAAQWALSKPQGQVIQSYVQGSHYVQLTKDPVTGAVSSNSFDLGFDPPKNWTFQKVGTQGLLAYDPATYNPSDSSTYKYYDATNGYQSQNQSLTIQTKEQNLKRSYATQAQSILRSTGLISGTGSSGAGGSIPAKFYQAVPIMDRINAAASQSPNNVADEDLVDALVSINTGGGKPSQAQFDILLKTQGLEDKGGILYQNYLNGSRFLSESTRKNLIALAKSNFQNLAKSKSDWDKTAADILAKNGLTKDKYDITTDTTFLNPPSASGSGTAIPETVMTTLTSNGWTDNGDGTWNGPDGNSYTYESSGNMLSSDGSTEVDPNQ